MHLRGFLSTYCLRHPRQVMYHKAFPLVKMLLLMHVMAQLFEMQGSYFLLLIFSLPLLFFIFRQLKSSFASHSSQLPPGPKPWPVLGNLLHMAKGGKPHVTLSTFAQTYGPLMSLKLGTQYVIVASSPTVAMQILKIHDRILSARQIPHALPATKTELKCSAIAMNEECNDGWKYLRTICRTELFSGKALESQECLREKNITEMLNFLRAKEGKPVNIGELVFTTVFNMLSNIFFSKDVLGLEEEIADGGLKAVIKARFEVLLPPNLSDFYPILSRLDLQGLRKKASNLAAKVQAIWEPIIDEKRKRGASLNQQDFLDCLLRNGFTSSQIHHLFTELYFAGTDTITTTVEWTMAELVKNPETMTKVREELATEINRDLPKEFQLMQLPYLQACFKETLRLHPPAAFLLPHRAHETCQVMDYTIPRNAQIFVNVWAIGRDPSIWNEPLEFRPERFLNSSLDYRGNDFEFLPFGAGRRLCPGLPMAARHIPLLLATLIHFFDWSLPHGNDPRQLDMNEKFGTTLQKEQPLILIPKARK